MDLDDPPTPKSYTVGSTAEEAAATLAQLGFEAEWYASDLTPLKTSGDWTPTADETVVWQHPLHHEATARFDGTFELVVASSSLRAQLWVVIPDFTDLTLQEAQDEANGLGLRLAVYDEDGHPLEYGSGSAGVNEVVLSNHSTTPAGATTNVGATVGVIIVIDR